tara:strand:- start:3544 stop:3924 length:381 start_codon:yes stop_codon:yes gene_type:complete
LLFLFKFNKFLPKIFIIKDVGVIIKKKIIPIIIGEIRFPSKIPNLNQILFKGVKILELNNPKIKKVKAIIIDHILISPLFIKGYTAIIKKKIKKTIPKLLLVEILILFFFIGRELIIYTQYSLNQS